MDRERYRLLQEIFTRARSMAPPDRPGFLQEACGKDLQLRADVDGLLAEHEDPVSLLKDDHGNLGAALLAGEIDGGGPQRGFAGGLENAPDRGSGPARRIGRYRILGTLGRGGMGVVYDAEQDEPKRPVALKVLDAGFPSASLLARFRFEVQVLGRLEHPGIARIYEAGTHGTDGTDGTDATAQPFFAMERISGRSVLEFAHERRLDIRARLDLVARICDAVHHAHQKGVIHRDLKPSNILVDESSAPPQPKILDFGIARATGADSQLLTVETMAGQLIGTLPYMSPEQAAGDPERLDTRSDIYSLGVILYEILSGRLPHELRATPLPEALRTIQEKDPPLLGRVDARFRGDCETIVAKALEKDRERRYASAQELAADIRRYLRDEPISARAATTFYQMRKFARRNRALVAGVAIGLVTMVAGTAVSLWQASVAIESRKLADERAAAAQFQAFRARLSAAAAAIETRDPSAFKEQMDAVEPPRRGWEWRYLMSRHDRSAAVVAPGEPIAAAAFHDNGSSVVTVLESGILVEWDAVTGDRGASRPLGPGPLGAAAFSGESSQAPSGALSPVALSPGKRLLAAVHGRERRAIGLWEVPSGRRVAGIASLEAPCHSLAIRDDGRWVVASGEGRIAWIWDGTSDRPLTLGPERIQPASAPRPIAFIPGTEEVVVSSLSGYFGRHDLRTGDLLRGKTESITAVCSLSFTDDGSTIAIGEKHNKIYVADMKTGLPLMALRGHRAAVRSVAFGTDGRRLASGGDQTVRLWDLASGKEVQVLTGHKGEVVHVAFDPRGSRILSVSGDQTARVWDLGGAGDTSLCNTQESHPRDVAFTPDGEQAITLSWHRRIEIWDAGSGERVAVFPAGSLGDSADNGTCMDLSPRDGGRIATGHNNGLLRIWDSYGARLLSERRAHGSSVWRVAFSPDGSRIATSCEGTVALWSVPDLAPVASNPGDQGDQAALKGKGAKGRRGKQPSGGIGFSPNGATLAAGFDSHVRLLALPELGTRLALRGHRNAVRSIAFSPDGVLLASGSRDGEIRIWEAGTGQFLREMKGHHDGPEALAFTPDSTRLASGFTDGTIRLWDVENGEDLLHLRGHSAAIHALAFSRDGKRLASGSNDGFLRFWGTEPDHVRRRARDQRRRLREEVRPLVERFLMDDDRPDRLIERVRAEVSLDGARRIVGFQEALRALSGRAGAPNPAR